ncbi:MAG: hypothetical protein KA998_00550 [Rickettsiaceae bacterium]|nr:hypothetical protein [Rickettsiaceae bacterium]
MTKEKIEKFRSLLDTELDTYEEIKLLCKQNEYLYPSFAKIVLEKYDIETAVDIFSFNQKLIHELYKSQKELLSENQAEEKTQEFANGVYEIGNGKGFFRISEARLSQPLNSDSKFNKISFIPAKSKGINGMKIYANKEAKLKINSDDKAFYSKKVFTYYTSGDKKYKFMIFFDDPETKHIKHTNLKQENKAEFKTLTEEQAYTFKYGSEEELTKIIGEMIHSDA